MAQLDSRIPLSLPILGILIIGLHIFTLTLKVCFKLIERSS